MEGVAVTLLWRVSDVWLATPVVAPKTKNKASTFVLDAPPTSWGSMDLLQLYQIWAPKLTPVENDRRDSFVIIFFFFLWIGTQLEDRAGDSRVSCTCRERERERERERACVEGRTHDGGCGLSCWANENETWGRNMGAGCPTKYRV